MALIGVSCKTQETHPIPPVNDTTYRLDVYGEKAVVLPDTIAFSIEADSISIMVVANRAGWDSQLEAQGDWLSMSKMAGDTGTTHLMIRATTNTLESARLGSISFIQKGSNITKKINIRQAPAPAVITSRKTDSLALVAIYNAFDGKNLFPKLWDLKSPITDPKKWEGITCALVDGEMRVVGFDFQNQDAKGEIPQELGTLRKLRNFCMHVVRVKGALPDGLGYASDLRRIDIKDSFGITALPSDMSRLAKLDSLNITGSSVPVLPSSMEHCVSLRELYANPMYSKAAPLSGNLNLIMKNMQDLKYVEIGECALTGDLSVLKNKKNLKSFVLFDRHKLSGNLNLGENLVGCDSLINLNLGSAPELTGTLKGFPTAPLLENFVIMDSKVGGSLEEGQFNTVAVERVKLWMPNNEFTGNVPADFTKKLMSANIAMNKLSGTLPQNIADSIIHYFTYGDRICVQKEGFGFTNCDEE